MQSSNDITPDQESHSDPFHYGRKKHTPTELANLKKQQAKYTGKYGVGNVTGAGGGSIQHLPQELQVAVDRLLAKSNKLNAQQINDLIESTKTTDYPTSVDAKSVVNKILGKEIPNNMYRELGTYTHDLVSDGRRFEIQKLKKPTRYKLTITRSKK